MRQGAHSGLDVNETVDDDSQRLLCLSLNIGVRRELTRNRAHDYLPREIALQPHRQSVRRVVPGDTAGSTGKIGRRKPHACLLEVRAKFVPEVFDLLPVLLKVSVGHCDVAGVHGDQPGRRLLKLGTLPDHRQTAAKLENRRESASQEVNDAIVWQRRSGLLVLLLDGPQFCNLDPQILVEYGQPRDAIQQFRRAALKNLPKIAKAGSGSGLSQMRLLSILPVPAA
jgi:hypothetical protein